MITCCHASPLIMSCAHAIYGAFTCFSSCHIISLQMGLLDSTLLHHGSTHHSITDKSLCIQNEQPGSHVMEHVLNQKYHHHYPLHGLIGQTCKHRTT